MSGKHTPGPDQGQSKVVPLTYEQEVHALLCAAAANTEGFLLYMETQAASESGDARKLTKKCIEWKRDDLRRIRELIPQALARRDKAARTAIKKATGGQ